MEYREYLCGVRGSSESDAATGHFSAARCPSLNCGMVLNLSNDCIKESSGQTVRGNTAKETAEDKRRARMKDHLFKVLNTTEYLKFATGATACSQGHRDGPDRETIALVSNVKQRRPFSWINTNWQADPSPRIKIGSFHRFESICGSMPRPGSYSLTVTASKVWHGNRDLNASIHGGIGGPGICPP